MTCHYTGLPCDCTAEGDCPHGDPDSALFDPQFDDEDEHEIDYELEMARQSHVLDGNRQIGAM